MLWSELHCREGSPVQYCSLQWATRPPLQPGLQSSLTKENLVQLGDLQHCSASSGDLSCPRTQVRTAVVMCVALHATADNGVHHSG